MTNPKPFRPEPTKGTNRSMYLWPRSKVPEKQRIYDYLHDHGWRYDAEATLWFTPEAWPTEGYGRLEYEPDHSQFCIQPPSTIIDGVPHRFTPLLQVEFTEPTNEITCPECEQPVGVENNRLNVHTWPPGERRTCAGSGRLVEGGVVLLASIFGRERAMIDALTKHVQDAAKKQYEYSIIRERRRGSDFEVRMEDGRIAKITVELVRIEEP